MSATLLEQRNCRWNFFQSQVNSFSGYHPSTLNARKNKNQLFVSFGFRVATKSSVTFMEFGTYIHHKG